MAEYAIGVTVEEGQKLVLQQCKKTATEEIPLEQSAGRILAYDITAMENIPPFARSPYDGYALRAQDVKKACKDSPVTLKIIQEIPAGHMANTSISRGEAMKILTGAPIPDGADVVVKFEDTDFTKDSVTLYDSYQSGSNIVPEGEDLTVGEIVAKKGTQVTPAVVGMLASIGCTKVSVYKKVKAAILSTGDELQEPGLPLEPGQIRNSSRYTIQAYVTQWNAEVIFTDTAKDDAADIADKAAKALANADILITTGGISVGDYDKILAAMELLPAKTLYWKMQMKPGAAMAASVYQDKIILSLSGNPSSAAVALFLIGMPAIKKMGGMQEYALESIQVKVLEDFLKKSPCRRFLPGMLKVIDGEACFMPSKKQGNGMLSPLRICDMLGEIEKGSPPLKKGSIIKAYRI